MEAKQLFTEDKIKTARYVVVEVTPKEGPIERTYGLFMNLDSVAKCNTALASTEEMFVFLWKDPVLHMYNLDRYDVTQIEMGERPASSLSKYYTKTEQVEAVQVLKLIHATLKEAGRVVEGDLIDTDKYEVPEATKDKIKETKPSVTGSTTWNRSGGTTYNNAACGYTTGGSYNSGTYVHKSVSTTWLQRTSKYPIEAAIQRMRAKIAEIKAGTYKSPQLPETPYDKKAKDLPADEKKAVSTPSDSNQNTADTDDDGSAAYEAAVRQMELLEGHFAC